jgi:hypothetical protein
MSASPVLPPALHGATRPSAATRGIPVPAVVAWLVVAEEPQRYNDLLVATVLPETYGR